MIASIQAQVWQFDIASIMGGPLRDGIIIGLKGPSDRSHAGTRTSRSEFQEALARPKHSPPSDQTATTWKLTRAVGVASSTWSHTPGSCRARGGALGPEYKIVEIGFDACRLRCRQPAVAPRLPLTPPETLIGRRALLAFNITTVDVRGHGPA